MYMLNRENWTWCIIHFKADNKTEKNFLNGGKWWVKQSHVPRAGYHTHCIMNVTSNAAFTVSYTATAEFVPSFSISQSSHPLGLKYYGWTEIYIFYLGGNLWVFFPQAFAVILHWNKSQNSQNSPLTGTPEECHLRILFQKEIKFQGLLLEHCSMSWGSSTK